MRAIVTLVLLLAVAGMAAAQEGEPEEPELVLPAPILSVQDVGVEGIEAGIPPEEDLLPPERSAPLPESNELEIREPGITLAPPRGEAVGEEAEGVAFFAEGQVGAGTLHQLVTELSIYRPGKDPGFKLSATYDMRDGLGGQAAGAGFHRKTAGIEGRLEVAAGAMGLEVVGTFDDRDTGLQGQSVYGSRVQRSTHIQVTGRYGLGALVGLSATLDGEATTLLLTRDAPDTPTSATDYRLRPTLGGELRTGPFRAALELGYGLTVGTQAGVEATATHRFSPRLVLGLDLPLHLAAQASVGWHGRVGAPGAVPFSLEISGNPVDPLWLRLAGGYRVAVQDRADAVAALPWSLPVTPADDERGWYGGGTVRVTVMGRLILSGGVQVSATQGAATLAATQEADGLYTVVSADLTRLGANAGLLWDIVPGVSTRLEYHREFLGRRWFEPTDVVLLGANASLAKGRVELYLEGRFALVPEIGVQIPLIDAGGSVRLTPNLRMVADVTDLLAPLTGAPRAGIGPFVEPGFGASVRLLVSL